MSDTLHVFEKSGCGKAPFRFIGIEERRGPMLIGSSNGVEHWAGSPGQPMGTCKHCGTSIAECCIIRDAEGKVFIVGNQCVSKTGDNGLISNAKAAVNKMRREATEKREKGQIDQARVALEDDAIRAALQAVKHPYSVRAERGETFLDYACWMLQGTNYSFRTAKAKVAREVLKLKVSPGTVAP